MSKTTEPTWPANRYPTPEEFRAWFLAQSEAGQLEIAERYIENAQTTATCFLMNHKGAIEQLHYANQRVAELMSEGGR